MVFDQWATNVWLLSGAFFLPYLVNCLILGGGCLAYRTRSTRLVSAVIAAGVVTQTAVMGLVVRLNLTAEIVEVSVFGQLLYVICFCLGTLLFIGSLYLLVEIFGNPGDDIDGDTGDDKPDPEPPAAPETSDRAYYTDKLPTQV